MMGNQEMRDGRIWCLSCEKWWKECPCPGEVSASFTIIPEMIEAQRPSATAYAEALERTLGALRDYDIREPGRFI